MAKIEYGYPRFKIERDIWLKFKAHCVNNDINIENGIRLVIVNYMKENKLIDESVPEII